jgi:hypothetical protein
VTDAHLAATSAGVLLLLVLLATDDDGFLFLLDHANLAFHEAGHVIYGLLGSTLALYGGTLGQLTFPLLAAAGFWRRGEPVAFALAGVWLFENFLNIARYMADARARQLPLVGGGEHDWTDIFSRWGVLSSDTAIAGLVDAAGWMGMIACWLWLARRWLDDRR